VYMRLSDTPIKDSEGIKQGIILDYDDENSLIGIKLRTTSELVHSATQRKTTMGVFKEQFIIDERGEHVAVILSLDEYEQLQEDLHDLAVLAERRTESTIEGITRITESAGSLRWKHCFPESLFVSRDWIRERVRRKNGWL